MYNYLKTLKNGLSFALFIMILALALIGPRSANADPGKHKHFGAPELDGTTAVQGLVLIGGALVLVRKYKRKG